MGRDIYNGFRLKPPRYRLPFQREWRTHGQQTGQMLGYVERVLLDERPQWVLVQGDVNSTLAGALAAKKLGIRVAHLEAGLRSFDPRMPEEHNRIMVDHISDLLFAPTVWAARQLKRERVRGDVHVVGNTVVDAVLANRVRARESRIHEELGLRPRQPFFLFTLHRQENLEGPRSLDILSDLLRRLIDVFELPLVFPIHPGTLARLKDSRHLAALEGLDNLKLIPPLRYLDFLRLLDTCRLVFTDSGGVQEEACILRVPAVTLRDNTERPETLQVGSNRLAGLDPGRAVAAARAMLRRPRRWANPFGDGRTGRAVVKILRKEMQAAS
jgi:UDP-N-acetylglucosamine 2-epimerase (non-hydrolysing)